MIPVVSIALLLTVSAYLGFWLPFHWKKSALASGLVWGFMPVLLHSLGVPGLLAALGIPAQFAFLLLAWPLLMLAVSSVGSFAGRHLGVRGRRSRGY